MAEGKSSPVRGFVEAMGPSLFEELDCLKRRIGLLEAKVALVEGGMDSPVGAEAVDMAHVVWTPPSTWRAKGAAQVSCGLTLCTDDKFSSGYHTCGCQNDGGVAPWLEVNEVAENQELAFEVGLDDCSACESVAGEMELTDEFLILACGDIRHDGSYPEAVAAFARR